MPATTPPDFAFPLYSSRYTVRAFRASSPCRSDVGRGACRDDGEADACFDGGPACVRSPFFAPPSGAARGGFAGDSAFARGPPWVSGASAESRFASARVAFGARVASGGGVDGRRRCVSAPRAYAREFVYLPAELALARGGPLLRVPVNATCNRRAARLGRSAGRSGAPDALFFCSVAALVEKSALARVLRAAAPTVCVSA